MAPHGFGLVIGLLFIWSCYIGCLFVGVAGAERVHKNQRWSGYGLIGLAALLGGVGGISNAIGPPWLWVSERLL